MSDQGAYSCEAINIKGSVFAIPDTVVVVSGSKGICQPPDFNSAALTNADCQRCFCFGVTSDCFSSGLSVSEVSRHRLLQLRPLRLRGESPPTASAPASPSQR